MLASVKSILLYWSYVSRECYQRGLDLGFTVMRRDSYLCPAVINFTTDVAPLLESQGIDLGTLTLPIEIRSGGIYYQSLSMTNNGYVVLQKICFRETRSFLDSLNIRGFGPHVVVGFRKYGSMEIQVGESVVAEALVVY